jgi:hypothetical protein
MVKRIAHELKEHIPFTALGAATGIPIMALILLFDVPYDTSETFFYTFHFAHIFMSAFVTTALYMRYRKGKIWTAILIGWTGALLTCTASDVLLPYLGGSLLLADMHLHVPFIERPYTIPLGLAGAALGYWKQTTKIPHFGHVLLSTWASLFYILAFGHIAANWIALLPVIILILFLSVWIPCVGSDIVYPLLLVRKEPELVSVEARELSR